MATQKPTGASGAKPPPPPPPPRPEPPAPKPAAPSRPEAMLFVELGHWTPAFLVADRCLKATNVRLLAIENADNLDVGLKFAGPLADLQEAGEIAAAAAKAMHARLTLVSVLANPDPALAALALAPPNFSPLTESYDSLTPREGFMSTPKALGLLETQGLVANLHAVDVMLKTSSVQIVGKEKLGGGYITVVVRGDIAAVQAAIEAGKKTVEKLGGKLIMADVLSNPHPELLALMPK
ncbi:MAG: BMC domain-containing protein [Planctomycetia bacterium]